MPVYMDRHYVEELHETLSRMRTDLREITPKGFDRAIPLSEVNWMNFKSASGKRSQ